MSIIQLEKDAPIGTMAVLQAITGHLDKQIEAVAKPKRDPILGQIVKLPDNWQVDKRKSAPWAQKITHGKVWARVVDENLFPTGGIAVTLLRPDGTETGQGVTFDALELSVCQTEESK